MPINKLWLLEKYELVKTGTHCKGTFQYLNLERHFRYMKMIWRTLYCNRVVFCLSVCNTAKVCSNVILCLCLGVPCGLLPAGFLTNYVGLLPLCMPHVKCLTFTLIWSPLCLLKSTGYATPYFIYSENFSSTWSSCSQQFALLHPQLVNFTGQEMKFGTYIWHLVISTIGFRVAKKLNISYWIPLTQSAVLEWCNFDFLILFQNTNFATFSTLSVHSTNSYGGVMEVSALASLPRWKRPQFPLRRRPHGPQS